MKNIRHVFNIKRRVNGFTSKLFLHNLALFLITMFCPLAIIESTILFMVYSWFGNEIKIQNHTILEQSVELVDTTLAEINTLDITFSTNQYILQSMKKIMKQHNELSYENLIRLEIIRSFLDSPAYQKKYIHSIYLYLNGCDVFLSSNEGLVNFNNALDTDWFEWYELNKNGATIYKSREIRSHSFQKDSNLVLSIYHPLYSVGSVTSSGILVINIDADYINEILTASNILQGQQIFIANDHNEVLLGNNSGFPGGELKNVLENPEDSFNCYLLGEKYLISRIQSNSKKLNYLLFTPYKSVYALPSKIRALLGLMSLLSFITGITLSYIFTRRSTNQIVEIIDIIEAAEANKPIPEQKKHHNAFSFIIQNIVRIFIENTYFKTQLREKTYKYRLMEMIALQSQLNPHFLFNTLETINWQSIKVTGKFTIVNDMISDLSAILQYSLEKPSSRVLLSEEKSVTCSYIRIMKCRFKDKFSVDWDIDACLENISVIRLIFQPLVENSIKHGFKSKPGNCKLRIKVFRDNDHIRFKLIDNGIGIDQAKLREIRSKMPDEDAEPGSIGLHNTSNRLKITYGSESCLHIYSIKNFGTVVYFDIPQSRTATD